MPKNAQSALEYLMIIGLTFGIIIPTVYLFYSYSRESNIQIVDSQINSIGSNIVNTAESIYYSGEHSKTIIEFNMPENVNGISIISERELVFTVGTEFGDTDIVFFSNVNLTTDPSYCRPENVYICDLSHIASQGHQKIKIESISGGAEVLIEKMSE